MNATLVCLLVTLPAHAPHSPIATESYFRPTLPVQRVFRAQSPGYDEVPRTFRDDTDSSGGADTSTLPPVTVPSTPWSPLGPGPGSYDPFLGAPATGFEIPGMDPWGQPIGPHGPQPYRFGWKTRADVAFLPKERTEAPLGQFGIFEVNTEFEYTTPAPWGWIFSATQQFNMRLWDGPDTTGAFGLPGQVFRFGWDLELATPANTPWSVLLAFNPSLNTDFERTPSSRAWNWDGRGILFWRASPRWMFAFGAGFWDRVRDRVVPYAGFVWTPNDRWEWRIIFPEPRISYLVGQVGGFTTWLYVTGEYHVEAYEIEFEPAGVRDRIELSDWRTLLGLRFDNGFVASFVEAGWVFGRDVRFQTFSPGFDISSGLIARIGLRY